MGQWGGVVRAQLVAVTLVRYGSSRIDARRLRTVHKPKILKKGTITVAGGGGARKTRCSHSGTTIYSRPRVFVNLLRARDQHRVGAQLLRCAAAADGHLQALRASTRSHTGRGAVMRACEVVVVCRRFYYEPIITPPPRRRHVASAAVAGEVTAAVTVGRPRWEGGTCQSQATGSFARNAFRPFAAAVNRLPRANVAHNYYVIQNTFREPSGLGLLTLPLFFSSNRKLLFSSTRAHAPKHRFGFSHRIGRPNLK